MKNNSQQKYWSKKNIITNYISDNIKFDRKQSTLAWKTMLKKTNNIKSILECGSNIGRNIESLKTINDKSKISIIEINKIAYDIVTKKFSLDKSFNGPISDCDFKKKTFDLVFTMGVLIHINRKDLIENMKKIFSLSNNYILIGEYFNRTPVTIQYRNKKNLLFKCDFGKIFIKNFSVKLIDYGFFWGHLYDQAGFDDITWWLFKKK